MESLQSCTKPSIHKDKTVMWPSYPHPYASKMSSLYSDSHLFIKVNFYVGSGDIWSWNYKTWFNTLCFLSIWSSILWQSSFLYWQKPGSLFNIMIQASFQCKYAGIILFMIPGNERRGNIVTSTLIGLARTQNDPWVYSYTSWGIPIMEIRWSHDHLMSTMHIRWSWDLVILPCRKHLYWNTRMWHLYFESGPLFLI